MLLVMPCSISGGGPKGNRSGVTPTSVVNLYGYEPGPEKVISTK